MNIIAEDGLSLPLRGRVTSRRIHENPSSIEVNRYGHTVVTISTDVRGPEDDVVDRLVGGGCAVLDRALCCLKKGGSVYSNHRLIHGREYKVALVPGDIVCPEKRITRKVWDLLGRKFGYEVPLAGVIEDLPFAVTKEMAGKQGAWYVSVPHKPLAPFRWKSGRYTFGLRWSDTGTPMVFAGWHLCDRPWTDGGLFAFHIPHTTRTLRH